MSRRHRLALVAAVVALAAMPALVLAHADLESATPTPGSTVTVAPPDLTATFTEAIDASKSSLVVLDGGGATVAEGGGPDLLQADGRTLVLLLPTLANGTYAVRWTSAATDGHIERGTFEFTVAVPAPSPSPSPAPSPSASTPSIPPSPVASPLPSVEPSAAPTASADAGTNGDGSTGSDASVLLPLAVAAVVAVAVGAYFLRARSR
jgi:methionine-rich copper-binding protein CopC